MVKLSANVQSLFIFTKYFTYTLDGAIKHLPHFLQALFKELLQASVVSVMDWDQLYLE